MGMACDTADRESRLNALWGKKPKDEFEKFGIVPLRVHLKKTMETIVYLWDEWLPPIIKKLTDLHVLMFLAYAHDVGKASPVFQFRKGRFQEIDYAVELKLKKAGFFSTKIREPNKTPHGLISYWILEQNGFHPSICTVVGGHHGLPARKAQLGIREGYKENCGFGHKIWEEAQKTIVDEAIEHSGLKAKRESLVLPRPEQVIYSGILMLADWLASCEDDVVMPAMWKHTSANNIFQERFNIEPPYPVQSALHKIALFAKEPGIFIVEAPMGEGKTEAALAASECLAEKFGARGVYFALPTQATSNAMFTRLLEWLKRFDNQDAPLSIGLAHGKAEFFDEYKNLVLSRYKTEEELGETESAVMVHDWLVGHKKGMFRDFVIGTIDHVLMAALKQKHLAMRHLGLANKVVVIDECHAYDVYMESYLLTAIRWLGAYKVPVIVLSATLPASRRASLVGEYLGKKNNFEAEMDWATTIQYPLITYTDGSCVKSMHVQYLASRSKIVRIEKIPTCNFESILNFLKTKLENGGNAGLIFNTVRKAREAFVALNGKIEDCNVELLHSGFMMCDRLDKERELISKLGKKDTHRDGRRIVIGTQVFEQSIDIDFDILFTELCPMDLLLQRIGRLHRHSSNRPQMLREPVCYVLGTSWGELDSGSSIVYGKYLLMRTLAFIPDEIRIPGDIPQLISEAYGVDEKEIPIEHIAEYEKAKHNWDVKTGNKKTKASNHKISRNLTDETIEDWSSSPCKESAGEATVRDGLDAIEVLLVQKKSGRLHFLPWVRNGEEIDHGTPNPEQAEAIAMCCVRLPYVFNKKIDETIQAIETAMVFEGLKHSWSDSHFLKGSLVVILDDKQEAEINGVILHYDKCLGLNYRNADE